MLALLMLSACNSDENAEPAATATATTAPEVIVIPTVTPADDAATAETTVPPVVNEETAEEQPTAVADASTDAPTVPPTAVPTLAPTPVPTAAPTRVALVRYRDNLYSRAGDFTILSSNFPVAPAGSHYDLWLTLEGNPRFRLGTIPSDQMQLSFTSAADQNLLSIYDGAILTLEPNINTPGEMGPIVMQGTIPPNALVHIRNIAVRFAENPEGISFLVGGETQLALAREHTGFMQEELAAANLADARRHAEHVVNILNGEGGEFFGDLDGDGIPQNPGDGVGVVGYLNGTKEQINLAINTDDATAEIKLHASHVLISSDNALTWTAEAVTMVMRILAADSTTEAQPVGEKLATLLDQARDGIDVDGDSAVLPIVGEGGLLTAYEHTLNMGAIELFPIAGFAPVVNTATEPVLKPTATSAPTEPPVPTPVPPTATPEPTLELTPVAAEVTIDIVDFAFADEILTVKVGTTVIWRNMGSRPHTVTADDGSFDTAIFQPGETRSVTFDTTGTFPYYCASTFGSSMC